MTTTTTTETMAAAANYDHGERWNETEYAYAERKLMWITNKSIVKQKPKCLVGWLVGRSRAPALSNLNRMQCQARPMYRRLESATKLFQAAFNRIAQAIRSIIFNLHGNSHVNCVTHSMHPHAVCTILLNTMHMHTSISSSSSYYAKFNSIYPSQNGINSKPSKYLTFPCRCNFISMQWYSIVIERETVWEIVFRPRN